MERRDILALGVAMAVAPSVFAAETGHVAYSPAAYSAALASGKAFLLDFYAPW